MAVFPLLISGKQGSGKSETSDVIQAILTKAGFHVVRYKFAEPLYEMHDMILEYMAELGFEVKKKDGLLLQLLGTDWGRTVFGEYVWVKCASWRYQQLRKENHESLLHQDTVMLIDDLRFKNELEAFREDGFTVRLTADREVRKARTPAWRENDTHQSEVDLDDSENLFDMLVETDSNLSVLEVANHISINFMALVQKIIQ